MATQGCPAKLTVPGEVEPLRISDVAVDTSVSGFSVCSTWTLTFSNPHSRTLKGDLEFQLPSDAQVCGFAMLIDGRMVEALSVEKKKAKAAFEASVRSGKASALVEVKAGNVFSTEVYPIPANGTTRVSITYEHDLSGPLSLPTGFGTKLDSLSVRVTVLESDAASAGSPDITSTAGLTFDSSRTPAGFVLSAKADAFDTGDEGGVTVVIPESGLRRDRIEDASEVPESPPVMAVQYGNDVIFQAVDFPPVPDTGDTDDAASRAKAAADASKTVCLAYDVSRSREGGSAANREREAAFLSMTLAAHMERTGATSVAVTLQPFSADLWEPQQFTVTPETGPTELMAAVANLAYDGATNLSVLADLLAPGHDFGYVILVTDGLITLGDELPELPTTAPVYAVAPDDRVNADVLRYLASRTGGAFYHLEKDAATEDDMAVAALSIGRPAFGFLGADYDASQVCDVFPAQPQRLLVSGKRFTVTGRLLPGVNEAKVSLRFGVGSNVSRTVSCVVKREAAVGGAAAGSLTRAWARMKVADLKLFAERNQAAIEALGREHNLVTAKTSLLVLRSAAEYRQYGITPNREQLPNVYAEVMRDEEAKERAEAQRVQSKLQSVQRMWKTWTDWHARDFNHHLCSALPQYSLTNAAPAIGAPDEPSLSGGGGGGYDGSADYLDVGVLNERSRVGSYSLAVDELASDGSSELEVEDDDDEDDGDCEPVARALAIQESEVAAAEIVLQRAEESRGEAPVRVVEEEEAAPRSRSKFSLFKSKSKKKKSAPARGRAAPKSAARGRAAAPSRRRSAPRAESLSRAAPSASRSSALPASASLSSALAPSPSAPPPPAPSASAAPCAPPPPGPPSASAARCAPPPPGPRAPIVSPPAPVSRQSAPASSIGGGSHDIQLQKWDPSMPYMVALKQCKDTASAYAAYLVEAGKGSNGTTPSFYFDVCEFFVSRDTTLAKRIISNVLEIKLEESVLIRLVAYKLQEMGDLKASASLFAKVLTLRDFEPQSYRDVGLVQGELKQYEAAVSNLWKVCTGKWDGRYNEVEITVLMELNRLVAVAKREGVPLSFLPDEFVKTFQANVEVDLRISMGWNLDDTDIDAHVIEPTGEEVYYSHKSSKLGAHFGRDFTRGYGPEWYVLKKALPGYYKVRAKYYSSQAATLAGGCTILLHVCTNYARENEEFKLITLRLQKTHDIVDVCNVVWDPEGVTKQKA